MRGKVTAPRETIYSARMIASVKLTPLKKKLHHKSNCWKEKKASRSESTSNYKLRSLVINPKYHEQTDIYWPSIYIFQCHRCSHPTSTSPKTSPHHSAAAGFVANCIINSHDKPEGTEGAIEVTKNNIKEIGDNPEQSCQGRGPCFLKIHFKINGKLPTIGILNTPMLF